LRIHALRDRERETSLSFIQAVEAASRVIKDQARSVLVPRRRFRREGAEGLKRFSRIPRPFRFAVTCGFRWFRQSPPGCSGEAFAPSPVPVSLA